jgi:hypothetical protein
MAGPQVDGFLPNTCCSTSASELVCSWDDPLAVDVDELDELDESDEVNIFSKDWVDDASELPSPPP